METSLYCPLKYQELKFFRKNPHCTSSVCDVDRIFDRSGNKGHEGHKGPRYEYNKVVHQVVEASNLSKVSLNDIRRPKHEIYHMMEELIDDAVLDFGSLDEVAFQSRGQRPTTTIHMGQLKLFLSTMQFLTYYTKPDKVTHVVYPGSAPGNNIGFLTELFPHCLWHLYDPRDEFSKDLYKNPKIKTLVVDYFLPEHMTKLKSEIKDRDEHVVLISDIRVCDDVTELTVERDMRLQEEWVRDLKPDYAQLKFRIPRFDSEVADGKIESVDGEWYKYLQGDIWLQMFGPQVTTETRLVVKKEDIDDPMVYSLRMYEGLMYYFNRRIRPSAFEGRKDTAFARNTDRCHDCMAMYALVEEYLEHSGIKGECEDESKALVEKIMGKIAGIKPKLAKLTNETLGRLKQ